MSGWVLYAALLLAFFVGVQAGIWAAHFDGTNP